MPVTEEEWRAAYGLVRERDVPFTTLSRQPVEPLYTDNDLAADRGASIGFPGQFPFRRGVYPSMYRGRLWTMRQLAGFGTAEETNGRFRYLLDHGQTGVRYAVADGAGLRLASIAGRGRAGGCRCGHRR